MKFRKKPVIIEAVQFEYSEEGIQKIKDFCGDNAGYFAKQRYPGAIGEFTITTLEDGINLKAKHVATEGDWIIKGVQGEFYPCKPDIFEQTYEEVREKVYHSCDIPGCVISDEALQLAIEAIENFKNVKGRYNTQIACEKLYAILPILKEAKEKNQ